MENRKAFIISGICFVISLVLIVSYVNVKEAELTEGFGDVEDVVIAVQSIKEYEIIRPDMVDMASNLGIKVYSKFKQASAATDISQVVGKASVVPIAAEEQVTLTKLVDSDGRPVLERQVSKDFRAMTLQVNPFNAVGRLIRPGNRVDVLLSVFYDAKGVNTFEVKTLAQNVLVLATGRRVQNEVPTRVNSEALNQMEAQFALRKRRDFYGAENNLVRARQTDSYRSITVHLAPALAEKIGFIVSQFGDTALYYTLRNSADQRIAEVKTTLLDNVLGPDSDYGRTRRKPPKVTPPNPQFYDSIGNRSKPVY